MIRRFMRWWLTAKWRESWLSDPEFIRHKWLLIAAGYGKPKRVYRWRERWGVWQFTGVVFAAPDNNKSAAASG